MSPCFLQCLTHPLPSLAVTCGTEQRYRSSMGPLQKILANGNNPLVDRSRCTGVGFTAQELHNNYDCCLGYTVAHSIEPTRDRQRERDKGGEREREREREREGGRVSCMDGGEGRRVRLRKDDTADKTIINRIMLRFRPIAPKPAAGDSNTDAVQVDNKNKLLNQRRSKRKYVRLRKNSECKRNRKITVSEEKIYTDGANRNYSVTTLQLFPERRDHLEEQSVGSGSTFSFGAKNDVYHGEINVDKAMPFNLNGTVMDDSDQASAITPEKRVTESCVTVESVTGAFKDVQGLGHTNADRIINLEGDTCPGFISDGCQVVRWVNEAYKRMVTLVRDGNADLGVRLVMKERLPYDHHKYNAFTCMVKLKDAWQKEKIVPCDVWRMDGGGFAWRLDVEAALSLGR